MPHSRNGDGSPTGRMERPARRRFLNQEDAIVEATWLYYNDGLNQNKIARHLGLSRASVVNCLAEGRRRGYVRVSLYHEIFAGHALADGLREKLCIERALVAPVHGETPDHGVDRVVRAGGEWLPRLLAPGRRLGVAWGETVYWLAESAPETPLEDLTVVQILGSLPPAGRFAAEACSAMMARRFGARLVNLRLPLLLSDRELAERLRSDPQVAEQFQAVTRCNKTIFACGTVGPDSHIARSGIIGQEILARMRAKGAAGMICARLIDGEGAPMPSGFEDRMNGVTLDQMRGKEMALLVAPGQERGIGARRDPGRIRDASRDMFRRRSSAAGRELTETCNAIQMGWRISLRRAAIINIGR